MQREKSGKMAIFCQIAILALLSLCIDFINCFCQMTSFWVLWKTYYWLLLKKCLWSCPGPSMYLSERINWIFQVSFIGFQKFFLFWVAGILLDAWAMELESAHFFVVMPSEKNSVFCFVPDFLFRSILRHCGAPNDNP